MVEEIEGNSMQCINRLLIVVAAIGTMSLGWSPALGQQPAGSGERRAAADLGNLDELLAQVRIYKLGESRRPLEQLAERVVQAQEDPRARSAISGKLAELLSGEATREAKDFACRQLYIIGTTSEIPVLAKLLPDEQLSHMARYVLEAMGEPAADTVMREALSSLRGRQLIGLVGSVGNRRDIQAVPRLKELLADADEDVAAAAAEALGEIAGPEATEALAARKSAESAVVRDAVADAYLKCADVLLTTGKGQEAARIYKEMFDAEQPKRVRVAAFRGLIASEPQSAPARLMEAALGSDAEMTALALQYVRELRREGITQAFSEALERAPADLKVLLLEALGDRGDPAAHAAVLSAVRSDDERVRSAALRALGSVGGTGDVPMLAELSANATGAERDAARQALVRLRGRDVNAAIEHAMRSDSAGIRAELARSLGPRGAYGMVPKLLDLAGGDEAEPVRIAALGSLGLLAREPEYPRVVERLAEAQSDAERRAAEEAVGKICSRMTDKEACAAPVATALRSAPAENKVVMVRSLSRIGGSTALAAVRRVMDDPAVQQSAIRAMTEWPDAATIPDLLKIAQSRDQTERVLAIRGLVRLIGLSSDRPVAETLKFYGQVMELAQRPEEKRLVLGGISNVRDPGALEMAAAHLDDPELRAEAGTAMLRIARNIMNSRREAARAALQTLLAAEGLDEGMRGQARELLDGR